MKLSFVIEQKKVAQKLIVKLFAKTVTKIDIGFGGIRLKIYMNSS